MQSKNVKLKSIYSVAINIIFESACLHPLTDKGRSEYRTSKKYDRQVKLSYKLTKEKAQIAVMIVIKAMAFCSFQR